MTYDFTSIMERHGQDAVAVDGLGAPGAPEAPQEGFDAIPMWRMYGGVAICFPCGWPI